MKMPRSLICSCGVQMHHLLLKVASCMCLMGMILCCRLTMIQRKSECLCILNQVLQTWQVVHPTQGRHTLSYDEYGREDFSFGNREDFKVEDMYKDGPRLDNKFGSTSTAALTPKLGEDGTKKNMLPSTVMIKLISVMTFGSSSGTLIPTPA